MDVKEFLGAEFPENSRVEISGWLVDKDEGLFILGDHYPEDHDFGYRVRIVNQNIIIPILRVVSRLGGGRSALFHRARAVAVANGDGLVRVEEISVESNRESGDFVVIDVSDKVVRDLKDSYGDYNFKKRSDPMSDWLDSL